jgi:osmotically inducible protein OsmC
MPLRSANAVWQGTLQEGSGTVKLGSGLFESGYSFTGRVEEGKSGTTPEELIAGAHAGCFAMAFSGQLSKAGFNPTRLDAKARVNLRVDDSGLKIDSIKLEVEGEVPGIDEAQFLELAENAKSGCPVSVALSAVDISLDARLVS